MPHRSYLQGVALCLLAAAAPAAARVRPAPAAFIPAGDVADAPSGFVGMCARDTVLCDSGIEVASAAPPPPLTIGFGTAALASREAPPMFVALHVRADGGRRRDPAENAALKLLRRINAKVNRTVAQAPDIETAGVAERWQRPSGPYPAGDCEDLAIEKRMRLIDAGFAPTRMFFAVAFLRGYGLHTVLVARLADGDYLLDSLSAHVLRWSDTHYNWLRQQSPDDPLVWRRIGAPARAETIADAGLPPSAGTGS